MEEKSESFASRTAASSDVGRKADFEEERMVLY